MNKSVWSEFDEKPNFKSLESDIDCDVLVIGGGMAGVLTAHYLKQSGRDVVLVEAKEIGGGITKNTTAVLTAQHCLFSDLIKMHGKKKAKDYLDVNLQAVEEYRKLCKNIDCDFDERPSYIYSLENDLIKEKKALNKLGYEAELTDKANLPFKIKNAIKFNNMAQFHPLKFLFNIAKDLKIFENTFINEIKDHTAFTEKYKINFKQAVVATHFPFIDSAGGFFVKMYQERSYVVALENASNVYGTYIGDDSSGYYFRNYKDLLFVGYGDHRTGTKTKAFQELDEFVKEHFKDAKIKYRWANQDCITLDSIPYVGKYGRYKDLFTVTGFNMWGMTGSMVGAKILTDLLNGKKNEFANTFKTKRRILRVQLFKNLGTFVLNLIKPTVKRCPHLGCALKYNKREHSWDCQCHGSRFQEDGKIIDNPTTKNAKVK